MYQLTVNGKRFETNSQTTYEIVVLFLRSKGDVPLKDVIDTIYYRRPGPEPYFAAARKALSRARQELVKQIGGEFLIWLPTSKRYRFMLAQITQDRRTAP